MLAGTKKLFPTDYEKFKEAMLNAAEEDELPVGLQLDETAGVTLKDLQELFYEFNKDTSLNLEGHLFLCNECGRIHLQLEVNYPEEEPKLLQ